MTTPLGQTSNAAQEGMTLARGFYESLMQFGYIDAPHWGTTADSVRPYRYWLFTTESPPPQQGVSLSLSSQRSNVK